MNNRACDGLGRFRSLVVIPASSPTASSSWWLSRAIVASPKLILADEPTGNLHADQGREIVELFERLNGEGTTIVQVTHNEAWAAYGQRIIRLKDGWMQKGET
jgi:ABC-type lipoprotein export system ATPase subunit